MTDQQQPNHKGVYRRWYDRQPRLSQSVRLITMFPDEIKEIICDGIMILANKEFEVTEKMKSFKTIGSEKVKGLHKSKRKLRDYDENPIMHKAMNYLYILSDGNQDFMAEQTLKLLAHIQDYLNACKMFQSDVSTDNVAEITRLFIESGDTKVQEFIDTIRKELHDALMVSEDHEPVDFIDNVIDDGTKISGKSPPSDT